jgi:hypothetical protein
MPTQILGHSRGSPKQSPGEMLAFRGFVAVAVTDLVGFGLQECRAATNSGREGSARGCSAEDQQPVGSTFPGACVASGGRRETASRRPVGRTFL